nr:MAG: hypothetical protein [Bacteriophage sp.]
MNAITFIAMVGAVWFGLGWTLGSGAIKHTKLLLKQATHPIEFIGLNLRIKQITQARKVLLARCIICLIVAVLAHLIVR